LYCYRERSEREIFVVVANLRKQKLSTEQQIETSMDAKYSHFVRPLGILMRL